MARSDRQGDKTELQENAIKASHKLLRENGKKLAAGKRNHKHLRLPGSRAEKKIEKNKEMQFKMSDGKAAYKKK